MSKSKLTKILVTVLMFCLLIGTIVGVTAVAQEENAGEGLTPEIISKNIEYGSKIYLFYAVPVNTVPEEDRDPGKIWLNVYDADGTLAFRQYAEAETVDIYENGTICYIFKTRGVPAKELNTIEKIQVETASGAIGALESHSVEEYLFERLYEEGFATKTEKDTGEDGKDYIRRNLYYNLLKYGAIAQELLAPDAEDKIGEINYVSAPEAKMTSGNVEHGSRFVISYDFNTPKVGDFIGWSYSRYDMFGEIIESGVAANGSSFYADGYFNAEPIYDNGDKNEITFDNESDSDYYSVTPGCPTANSNSTTIAKLVDASGSTIGTDASKTVQDGGIRYLNWATGDIVDNSGDKSYLLNKIYKFSGGNGTQSGFFVTKPTVANADANVSIFEADVCFSIDANSKFELYFYLGGSSTVSTDGAYYGYFRGTSNGNGTAITLDSDFYYPTSSRTSKSVSKDIGVKTGETFKFRVEYWEGDRIGEALTRIYINGTLVHETTLIAGKSFNTSGNAPQAESVDYVGINFGNTPIMSLNIDNVSLCQKELAFPDSVNSSMELIDFDFYSGLSGLSSTNATNYFEQLTDELGNGTLYANKSVTGVGMSWATNVTYTEANANLMVFEFDIKVKTGSNTNNFQINAGHKHTSGGSSNTQTPLLLTVPTNIRDEWVTIRVEYQALEVTVVDGVTKAKTVCVRIYENGVLRGSNDPSNKIDGWNAQSHTQNGAYASATSIKQIPLPSEMMNAKFSLNYSCKGEYEFDNISLKLIYKDGCDPTVVSA